MSSKWIGFHSRLGGLRTSAYLNKEVRDATMGVTLEWERRIRPAVDCQDGYLVVPVYGRRLPRTNRLVGNISFHTDTALRLFNHLWWLFRQPRGITMWVDKTRKLNNKEPGCTYPLLGGGHQRVTFHPEPLAFPSDMTSWLEQEEWAEAVPGKIVAWQNEPGWRAPDWAEASAFLKARRPFWREEQYFILADSGRSGDVLWAVPARNGSVTFHRWNIDRLGKHCKTLHNRSVLVGALTLRVRTKSDQ